MEALKPATWDYFFYSKSGSKEEQKGFNPGLLEQLLLWTSQSVWRGRGKLIHTEFLTFGTDDILGQIIVF